MPKAAGEFDLIARYLAPLTTGVPGAFSLTDDCALIDPDPDASLAVTTDTMVAGVHFPLSTSPGAVAAKLLRVNLSDLAAMGARPLWYSLSIALPQGTGEDWIAAFASSLGEEQARWSIDLTGGDTVATPGPLTVTVTAVGETPKGLALRRNGARPGDLIWVSGTIGDAALGLKGEGETAKDRDFLRQRLELPSPRIELGRCLLLEGLASACADISDGLVADLGHICQASNVAGVVETAMLPLSDAALRVMAAKPGFSELPLTGGDDYELVFTADPSADIARLPPRLGIRLTPIGHIEESATPGVRVVDPSGSDVTPLKGGYRHF